MSSAVSICESIAYEFIGRYAMARMVAVVGGASTMELAAMSEKPSQEARCERLWKVYRSDLPALTIILARRYLADYPDHWPIWVWLEMP